MTEIAAREGETFNAWEALTVITCCRCGIPFAVPDHWREQRMNKQDTFYCPNGHTQSYTKSTSQRLRDQLKSKQKEVDRERRRTDEARRQRDATRKSHRKMRDRVKNGVCPCCNRSFQNLLQHIKTQHPEFGERQTLRQIRDSYGMTQSDLATEVGVEQAHVSCFECGRSVATWARDQIEAWIDEQGRADE